MVGVDYSEGSVELARAIGSGKEYEAVGGGEVRFLRIDVIQHDGDLKDFGIERVQKEGGFDVVLDKGTFDAISLCDDVVIDSNTGEEVKVHEAYPGKVGRWVKPETGILLITSCNWTEEELISKITAARGVKLEMYGRIKYPEFTFGGKKGSTVCTVGFRRRL